MSKPENPPLFGIDYLSLPEHMREPVRLYIEDGHPIGGFLTAIMANDFIEAVCKADEHNQMALLEWARFIYNEAPGTCHGSYEIVREWQERGGLNGERAKRGES